MRRLFKRRITVAGIHIIHVGIHVNIWSMDAFWIYFKKILIIAFIGNHEHHYNFSNYKARFTMPGDNEKMFYSFNIGAVHFVAGKLREGVRPGRR